MRNIFYIGMPKTGSVSLNISLSHLGYKTIQDYAGFVVPFSQRVKSGERDDRIKPDSGTAILDLGVREVRDFRMIDQLYPGSRFIAIHRPLHSWIESCLTHCLWSRRTGKGGWIDIETGDYEREYQNHYREIQDYFCSRDQDFLLMESDSVGWAELCRFLGRPVPPSNVVYPHAHTGREKIRDLAGGGFTEGTDWASHNYPEWRELFSSHLRENGRSAVRMLEIGCYEGRSTLWWLDNLLKHPDSRITCIDPWARPEVERKFDVNIALSGQSEKVVKRKGLSRFFVPHVPDGSLDIAYVDGSHEGRDVIHDGLMCLDKLKVGGILLFDDYEWSNTENFRKHPPKPAIDSFLELCGDRVQLLRKGYQVAILKTS